MINWNIFWYLLSYKLKVFVVLIKQIALYKSYHITTRIDKNVPVKRKKIKALKFIDICSNAISDEKLKLFFLKMLYFLHIRRKFSHSQLKPTEKISYNFDINKRLDQYGFHLLCKPYYFFFKYDRLA